MKLLNILKVAVLEVIAIWTIYSKLDKRKKNIANSYNLRPSLSVPNLNS
jgi:hypothetical protein